MEETATAPSGLGGVPTDLLAIGLFASGVGVVLFAIPVELPLLRPIVGLAFVMFVPGYALLAMLFPRHSHGLRQTHSDTIHRRWPGLTGIERLVLSMATSIAIVVLVGLFLGATRWGISSITLYVVLSAITGVELVVAAIARTSIPHDHRIDAAAVRWMHRCGSIGGTSGGRLETAVNLWLVVLVILAVPALGLAVNTQGDDGLTEAYLLTYESDTAFVAEEYPDTFIENQTERLWLGLGNYEGTPSDYSVVVVLQRTEQVDGTATVTEEAELLRMNVSLDADEEQRLEHTITPGEVMRGEDLRLVYLVYLDDPPDTPTVENAYRSLHLWIDVSDDPDQGEQS